MYDDLLGSRHVGSEQYGGIALFLPQYLLEVLKHYTVHTVNYLETEGIIKIGA